jgi:hypothetical protein
VRSTRRAGSGKRGQTPFPARSPVLNKSDSRFVVNSKLSSGIGRRHRFTPRFSGRVAKSGNPHRPIITPSFGPLCPVNRSPVHRTVLTRPPAKLNLFLELLGKRDDGYHEIETVMVAIDWRDELTVTVTDEPEIRLRVDWNPSEEILAGRLGVAEDRARRESLLGIPNGRSNLVHRALTRFADQFAIARWLPGGTSQADSGGRRDGGRQQRCGSGTAGGRHAVRDFYVRPQLQTIAAEIGSDVPFFLGLGGEPVLAAVRTAAGS